MPKIASVSGKSVLVSTSQKGEKLQTFQIEGLKDFKQKCLDYLLKQVNPQYIEKVIHNFNVLWMADVEVHTIAPHPAPREHLIKFSLSETELNFNENVYPENQYAIHIDIDEDSAITIELLK